MRFFNPALLHKMAAGGKGLTKEQVDYLLKKYGLEDMTGYLQGLKFLNPDGTMTDDQLQKVVKMVNDYRANEAKDKGEQPPEPITTDAIYTEVSQQGQGQGDNPAPAQPADGGEQPAEGGEQPAADPEDPATDPEQPNAPAEGGEQPAAPADDGSTEKEDLPDQQPEQPKEDPAKTPEATPPANGGAGTPPANGNTPVNPPANPNNGSTTTTTTTTTTPDKKPDETPADPNNPGTNFLGLVNLPEDYNISKGFSDFGDWMSGKKDVAEAAGNRALAYFAPRLGAAIGLGGLMSILAGRKGGIMVPLLGAIGGFLLGGPLMNMLNSIFGPTKTTEQTKKDELDAAVKTINDPNATPEQKEKAREKIKNEYPEVAPPEEPKDGDIQVLPPGTKDPLAPKEPGDGSNPAGTPPADGSAPGAVPPTGETGENEPTNSTEGQDLEGQQTTTAIPGTPVTPMGFQDPNGDYMRTVDPYNPITNMIPSALNAQQEALADFWYRTHPMGVSDTGTLAAMTPQNRRIYLVNQLHALRMQNPEAYNELYQQFADDARGVKPDPRMYAGLAAPGEEEYYKSQIGDTYQAPREGEYDFQQRALGNLLYENGWFGENMERLKGLDPDARNKELVDYVNRLRRYNPDEFEQLYNQAQGDTWENEFNQAYEQANGAEALKQLKADENKYNNEYANYVGANQKSGRWKLGDFDQYTRLKNRDNDINSVGTGENTPPTQPVTKEQPSARTGVSDIDRAVTGFRDFITLRPFRNDSASNRSPQPGNRQIAGTPRPNNREKNQLSAPTLNFDQKKRMGLA